MKSTEESNQKEFINGTVKTILMALSEIEKTKMLPENFLIHTLNDSCRSDWQFVITSIAYIEILMAFAFEMSVGKTMLECFNRLPLLDEKKGKLAFVDAVHKIPSSKKKIIKSLGGLRNSLVHDFGNLSFSFTSDHGNANVDSLLRLLNEYRNYTIEIGGARDAIYLFLLEITLDIVGPK